MVDAEQLNDPNTMDEVAPGLFVGTPDDAGDATTLRDRSVTTVVSLTHQTPDVEAADVVVVDVSMRDGPQNDRDAFTKAVTELRTALERGESVLVHCSAGASRSPAVAATALALHDDRPLEDAFEQVADRRAAVDPHPAVVRQAANVFSSERT